MATNKIEVTINGDNYVLKSNRTDDEMHKVANYVDQMIQQFGHEEMRFNKTMQATLACVNLTDQYFELEEINKNLTDKLAKLQGENKNLNEKLEEAEEKLSEQEDAAHDRELDLEALRGNLQEAEAKILEISKQYQEFRRSHR